MTCVLGFFGLFVGDFGCVWLLWDYFVYFGILGGFPDCWFSGLIEICCFDSASV